MPAHDFWQPDPTGRHQQRWRNRDGTWGSQVNDGGVVSDDPYTGTQPSAGPDDSTVPEPVPVPTVPAPAAARQPVGFWGQALAIAVGVALGLLTTLIILAMVAAEALEDAL